MRFKKTLIGIACAGALTGALALFILRPWVRVRGGYKITCPMNLRSINLSMLMYDNEFGEYPNEISNLYPDFLRGKKHFVCPSSKDKIEYSFGDVDSVKGIKRVRNSIDLNTSYVYFKPNENAKPEDIILSDRGPNHKEGGWVSNLECRVYWIDEKEKLNQKP